VLSTSGLSHYPRPNPPLTGLTLATRHENLYPSLSCPPAPPPRPPPSPFSMRHHRRSLIHSVECPTKLATSWYTQSCDTINHDVLYQTGKYAYGNSAYCERNTNVAHRSVQARTQRA